MGLQKLSSERSSEKPPDGRLSIIKLSVLETPDIEPTPDEVFNV